MNEIITKIINERQTVKSYSAKPISDKDWQQVIEMIQWSPSSMGVEPYRVLVIHRTPRTAKMRQAMREVAWDQPVFTEADKLVFFLAFKSEKISGGSWFYDQQYRFARDIDNLVGEKARERALSETKRFTDFLATAESDLTQWAVHQTYICLANALVAATLLNIGSTPLEGFDRAVVTQLLRAEGLINADERVGVAAAFGYPTDRTAYYHHGNGNRVRTPKVEKFIEFK